MSYLPTSQAFLEQSSLLLDAYPDSVRHVHVWCCWANAFFLSFVFISFFSTYPAKQTSQLANSHKPRPE